MMRVNTANQPSTSDKNLVNFGPVIPEFCRSVNAPGKLFTLCHCHAFAVVKGRLHH